MRNRGRGRAGSRPRVSPTVPRAAVCAPRDVPGRCGRAVRRGFEPARRGFEAQADGRRGDLGVAGWQLFPQEDTVRMAALVRSSSRRDDARRTRVPTARMAALGPGAPARRGPRAGRLRAVEVVVAAGIVVAVAAAVRSTRSPAGSRCLSQITRSARRAAASATASPWRSSSSVSVMGGATLGVAVASVLSSLDRRPLVGRRWRSLPSW